MGTFNRILLSLASLCIGIEAQGILGGIGFIPNDAIYDSAARNPLNKTVVSFPGFNFNADPASTDNATSENTWSWNAALSIINVDSNETNYPIASAANSTSNILNIAYTLDFPDGQLPSPNDTDWTLCAQVLEVEWTEDVLRRALNDPGDCSTVLGASCYNKVHEAWRQSSTTTSTGCPHIMGFDTISECASVLEGGFGIYSAPITSFHDNATNSSLVGLKSGQIFSYEISQRFNRSNAKEDYDKFASKLGIMVLNFAPSKAYDTNNSGTINPGEVRTFCSVLNKDLSPTNGNAALKLNPLCAIGFSMVLWTLLFVSNLI